MLLYLLLIELCICLCLVQYTNGVSSVDYYTSLPFNIIRAESVPYQATPITQYLCDTAECVDVQMSHVPNQAWNTTSKKYTTKAVDDNFDESTPRPLHSSWVSCRRSVSGNTDVYCSDVAVYNSRESNQPPDISDTNMHLKHRKMKSDMFWAPSAQIVPVRAGGSLVGDSSALSPKPTAFNLANAGIVVSLLIGIANSAAIGKLFQEIERLDGRIDDLKKELDIFKDWTLNEIQLLWNHSIQTADTLAQTTRSLVITIGLQAMSSGETALREAYLHRRLQILPAFAAALVLDSASNLGLRVPIQYNGTRKMESYHYFGLVDPKVTPLDVSSTKCGFPSFLIAEIWEERYPWTQSLYYAVVFHVQPLVPINVATFKYCTGPDTSLGGYQPTSAELLYPYNNGCYEGRFNNNGAHNYSIPWQLALYLSGEYKLRIATPLTTHTSRKSLHRQYQINEKTGFFEASEDLSGIDPSFDKTNFYNSTCPGTSAEILLPYTDDIPETSTGCISSTDWLNTYTSSSLRACHKKRKFYSGKQMAHEPYAISEAQEPVYKGVVEYLKDDGLVFRTIGISNKTSIVYLITRNPTYYYNSSHGFGRSPEFKPEWITEDGISVPEALIEQHMSLGISTGSTYLSISSIPSGIYSIHKLHPTNCNSAACLFNREAYQWDPVNKRYGEPIYAETIQDVPSPMTCNSAYKCSTVGQLALSQDIIPEACGENDSVCCNERGYVCFVAFTNRTLISEDLIGKVSVKLTDINNVLTYLQQDTALNGNVNYTNLINLLKAAHDGYNNVVLPPNIPNTGGSSSWWDGFNPFDSLPDFLSSMNTIVIIIIAAVLIKLVWQKSNSGGGGQRTAFGEAGFFPLGTAASFPASASTSSVEMTGF